MADERTDDDQLYRPGVGSIVSRRRLLQVTAFGAAGASTMAHDGMVLAAESDHPDHDHAGERLGVETPVEAITANSMSIRDFNEPDNFLVFEDDGVWYAYQTGPQEILTSNADGVAVINDALEACGNVRDAKVWATGIVRVVASADGTVLESDTTIEHVHEGAKLILEHGVTFEYTGDDEAVLLEASNNTRFSFDVIDANGADYCIRDRVTGTGTTEGNTLRGASDAIWVVDLPEGGASGAGHFIDVREFDCTAHPTPYGFRAPSPDVRAGTEGYWFDIGIVRGPTEVGIRIGSDDTPKEEFKKSVSFFLFDTYVDGATNDARHLVEINDKQCGVILRGFTPATGGDWDVVMGDTTVDCPVIATSRRHDLRVKRETLQTVNPSKFDEFSPEVVETELHPESLEGYERTLSGSADVSVDGGGGHVEHRTGATPGSRAGVQRSVPPFSDVSFDQQAAIQTSVIFPEDAGYDAWLLWGDPDGQAVGWRVSSNQLLGYVSDGDSETTLPLLSEGDVNAGDAWNLTAFYNPPTDVVYYVDDLTTKKVTTSTGGEATLTVDHPDGNENIAVVADGRDIRYAGRIGSDLPSDNDDADRIMTIVLENTVPANRRLRWSNWRNHRYPDGGEQS